jgi:cytochrome c-type biogenesis protein CcmH/NrfG
MPHIHPPERRWYQGPKVALAAIAAVVVLGLVVVFLLWWLKDTTGQTKAVLNRSAEKQYAGDYQGAVKDLKAQLTRVRSSDEKVELYMAIGAVYATQPNNEAALEAFKTAGGMRPDSFGINRAIAEMAEVNNDKTLALNYYQRCLKLLKDGAARQSEGEREKIEAKVKELGGQV